MMRHMSTGMKKSLARKLINSSSAGAFPTKPVIQIVHPESGGGIRPLPFSFFSSWS
jgi:hypothetical protein